MIGVIDYFEKLARLMTDKPVTVAIEGTEAYCIIGQAKIVLPADVMKDKRYHSQAFATYITELADKWETEPALFRAWLLTMLGYHEISHILFTPPDFGEIMQLAGRDAKLTGDYMPVLMNLHNFLEDRRIEHELGMEFPYIRQKLALMNRVLLTTLEIPTGFKEASIEEMLAMARSIPQVREMLIATIIMAAASHYNEVDNPFRKIDINQPLPRRLCQIMAEVDRTEANISHSQAVEWALEIMRLIDLPADQAEGQVQSGAPTKSDKKGEPGDSGATEGQEPIDAQGEGQKTAQGQGKGPGQADKEELKAETEGQEAKEETGQGQGDNPADDETEGQPMKTHRHSFTDGPDQPTDRRATKEELTKEMHDFQAELANAKLQADVLRTTGTNIKTQGLIKPDLVRKLEGQLSKLVKSLRSKKEIVDYDGHSMEPEMICQIKAEPSSIGETKLYQSSQKDKADFHIIFCVDQSGSMSGWEGSRGETRQIAANQVTANLCHALDKVQIKTEIIYFTDQARLIKDSTVKAISSPIGEQEPGGENEICKAVKLAQERLKKSQSDRKAVIVLTDGGDNTYEETGQLIRANPSVEHYFVWIFSSDNFLEHMTKTTGARANGSIKIDRLADMGPGTENLVKTFLARTKLTRGG